MELTHGFKWHETQRRDIEVLSLPTGQCLILKAS